MAADPVLARVLAKVLAQDLGRQDAQDAARRELSRSEYAAARPPLLLRAIGRALRWVGHLLANVTGGVGTGLVARVLLVALLLAAVAVALVRLGPVRASASRAGAVFDGGRALTAQEHRAASEAMAREGRYAEAVRERLRAVVRELEERGVLDPRPGRTAGEVARDGGAAVPVLAADLRRAAAVFDEVWYGGRPGGPEALAALVAVDDRVRVARTVPV